MERAFKPVCEFCAAETDELFRLPLMLQLGDRLLWVVCRRCYTHLSGARPLPRTALVPDPAGA
jgi:hypothetical protein